MWIHIRRATALLSVVVLSAAIAAAQAKAAEPQFDVVSIKPNAGTGGSKLGVTPGRATLTNITLRTLIQFAYDVKPREFAPGAPDWINTEHFDILATADPSSSVQQMTVMLRGLLVDRFQLISHKETREVPIYALTLARKDGKLGPKLHTSAVDCVANGARALDSQAQAVAQDPATRCMILPLFGQGRFQARGLRMVNIASALNNVVDRTIVDKTGLTGGFEFDLSWTPDALLQPGAAGAANRPAEITGPSLFTALEEQLGLKLNPERGPSEFLVIDRVERPKPD